MSLEKMQFSDKEYSQNHFVHLREIILRKFNSELENGLDKQTIKDYARAYCMIQRELGTGSFSAEQTSPSSFLPEEVRWNMALNFSYHGRWDLMKEEMTKEVESIFDSASSAKEVERGYALKSLADLI